MAKGKKTKQATTASPSNLRMFYGVLAVIAVIGIGWIGYAAMNRGGTAALEPITLAGLDDPQTLLQKAQGVQVGPDAAPVQVLVFSDYTCPACRGFSQMSEPQVKAEFVETGQVRFTYYDFPLGGEAQHRHGFLAARAARCAGEQGKFWEYHDLLFGRQTEWSFSRTPPVKEFIDYSRLLTLDASAFESCVNSERHADVVTANRVLGEQLGVGATPTIFVGGRSAPSWDYDTIRGLIQRELGTAPPAASSPPAGS